MEFKKYDSLENAYRQKFVDACQNLGIQDWVATVKVHGANFGFISDGTDVTPFKRTSVIGKNPDTSMYEFYGCNDVVERYRDKIVQMCFSIGGGETVYVYGELYGQGVQKEINYGQKDFIIFDIKVGNSWLTWDEVNYMAEKFGLPVVPELGRGTLQEMLEISPEFVCPLSPTGDRSEGLVIKPLTDADMMLPTGSRPIVKNKSKAFSEKKHREPKKPYSVPAHLQKLVKDFSQYLNENRLSNVLSKIDRTTITQKDFGKVLGMLIQDAKEEFERDEYEISKDDWKGVGKSVNKIAGEVLRKEWLNILDG